jgi:hypothetical protein
MSRKHYPSDISRDPFEPIRSLLEGGEEQYLCAAGRFVRHILRDFVFVEKYCERKLETSLPFVVPAFLALLLRRH